VPTAAPIGRDDELAACDAFLHSLSEGPRALVIAGEAGIGKTTVWAAAAGHARAAGLRVLEAAPSESERELAFAGLADLVGDLDVELAALPEPQRRALEIALLRISSPVAPERRALGAAFLGVLRHLAAAGPVVVAVDDMQWLDPPSAIALEFALRRVRLERVGLLAALRSGFEAPAGLDHPAPALEVSWLTLKPLTLAASFQLLRDRLGLSLARPALVRVHEACGGNPLYAMVLGRELREGRLRLSPGAPVPLPAGLLDLVARRTRRLPASTREVLVATAALARPSTEVLETAFGRAPVAAALERASRVGVVEVERDTVRFAHPLFASASYGSAPAHVRRAVHRRLARAVTDPEERARQLALGTARRDERAAASLELAAGRAAARGAPGSAAELMELAIELTPGRPAAPVRVRRALAAVDLHATAGELARAQELGRDVLEQLPRGPLRAQAGLALAAAHEDDLERMTGLVEDALGEPGVDTLLRARLLAQLAEALFRRGQARDAVAPAREGLALARASGDTPVTLALVARVATTELWAGEIGADLLAGGRGSGMLAEGAALEERSRLGLPFGESPTATLGVLLLHVGAMDEARALFERVLQAAVERGDERSRVRALWHLAQLEDYAGRWDEASRLIEEATGLEEQIGLESGAGQFARAGRAATLGHVAEAEALVAEGAARAREAGDVPYELLTLGVLGFLCLSLGDAERAVRILVPVLERAAGLSEPRVNRYWPDAIEALVAVGDLERARCYLDVYAAEAARLGVPRSLARAAHCRGVLATGAGEAEAALEAFDEALAIHERCPNVFEHGRTLLALGVARRRLRRRGAARAAMEQALAVFEALPAPLWAERARAELSRTGRRRTGELSENERLVAQLAGQGLTNREIASRAFLTPKSVEDVLRRVYAHVGVRNKTELAARLREPDRRETTG
jgi:tetratricopeptide (TPR) repeat protein